MLYNLSKEQAQQVLALIANSNIRGADAPAVMELARIFNTPVDAMYELKKIPKVEKPNEEKQKKKDGEKS